MTGWGWVHLALHPASAPTPQWIAPDVARMGTAVDGALTEAGLEAAAVDHVFLTGGTSFVPAVRRLFEERFGSERVTSGGEFVSVSEGLALMATSPR